MKKLTVKQEKFCMAFVETGDYSEAYRRSYNAENMSLPTINKRSSELNQNGYIKGRIAELMSDLLVIHKKTMADLLRDLDEAREIAKEIKSPAAMITATMSHARLTGMDKIVDEDDKGQTLDITFSVATPVDDVKVTVGKPKE